MNTPKLILASGSPRRRALLSAAGFAFEVIVSDAEESMPDSDEPADVAKHNALVKAIAVAESQPQDALVIGADTIVTLDGHLYGKPIDDAQAAQTLAELSGKTHQVITGVALVMGDAFFSFHETTDVVLKELSEETIAAYVATGDPLDKAGAYGIQSSGGHIVDHIDGDYDNVVGLPVTRLSRMLAKLGIEPAESSRPTRS